MKVLAIANKLLKEELIQGASPSTINFTWMEEPGAIPAQEGYDLCIDLLFVNNPGRIAFLRQTKASLVIINSVTHTLEEIAGDFVRINGWPGFLKRGIVEASSMKAELKTMTDKFFALLGKKTEWTSDIPGFIAARVVASIINEAYFALEEGVSTKQEIDTAMKLGTNYPYGPFEWCEMIGPSRIQGLLRRLSQVHNRYTPALLLTKEING